MRWLPFLLLLLLPARSWATVSDSLSTAPPKRFSYREARRVERQHNKRVHHARHLNRRAGRQFQRMRRAQERQSPKLRTKGSL